MYNHIYIYIYICRGGARQLPCSQGGQLPSPEDDPVGCLRRDPMIRGRKMDLKIRLLI